MGGKTVRTGVLVLAAWSSFAHAAPERPERPDPLGIEAKEASSSGSRALGGHTFLPSQLVPWPFATTHFGNVTGIGYSKVLHAGQDVNGNPIVESMGLGSFSERFELGIALVEWLALHANIGGQMLAGTTATSALNIGAVLSYDFAGGLLFRLARVRDRFQLALGVDLRYAGGKRLQPIEMVEIDPLGNVNLNRTRLLSDVGSFAVTPSLRFALSPLRAMGIQSALSFGYQQSEQGAREASNALVLWALALTIDAGAAGVPLGVLAGYGLERGFHDRAETEHSVEGGLFYTGRPNLTLGAVVMRRTAAQDSRTLLCVIRLFYVW